jgi:lactoylglutathione lyase
MTWATGIGAITVFTEDLAAARAFYLEVFELPVHWQDEVSCVFRVGDVLINLLDAAEAPELIGPHPLAAPDAGARAQFTITVDDVDAVAERVVAHGARLVNGPLDRPWGIRTALFADPAGTLWEIAAPLA